MTEKTQKRETIAQEILEFNAQIDLQMREEDDTHVEQRK